MYLCFVDEAGDAQPIPGPVGGYTEIAPVFVLGGLIIDAAVLADISKDYLILKARFFPGLMSSVSHHLDSVLIEVKSSDLRRSVRRGSRRSRRTAIGFLDRTLDLLSDYHAAVVARVWVKQPGVSFNGRSTYTYSMQDLCRGFQSYLDSKSVRGLVIADSRTHQLDERVAHSLFTMKHRVGGDELDRIVEVPTFGRSGNHVGLQLSDVLNGLILAIATRTYCDGLVTGPHVDASYDDLRARYGPRLKAMQYRYMRADGRWRGGITVSDPVGGQSGARLFEMP